MAILCLATDLKDLEKRLGDIIVAYRRDKSARLCPRPQGPRRDGRAAQGRHAAEPRADAGEQPGLRAWRPLRQHRAWLQLGRRHHDRAEARRLCRHRSRFRRRPRRREILRHQMPQGRAEAGCRGHRRYCARDEDEWRRQEGRPRQGEHRGGEEGLRQSRPSHREREAVRRAGRGRHQPFLFRHRRRDPGDEGLCRLDGRGGDPVQALGAWLGRHRGTRAQDRRLSPSPARRSSRRSIPTT